MNMYPAKKIVELLNQNAERVANHLLPNGKRKGREWCVGSIQNEKGNSLKICLSGDKTGIWCDFATGQSGDLLNLWCHCRNLSVREAIFEVMQWLGIATPEFEPKRLSRWARPVFKKERILEVGMAASTYLIEERKIPVETLKKYLIRTINQEIVFPYYLDGQLKMAKHMKITRTNDKKILHVTPNCEPCLFGWHAICKDARNLVIVEGEIDAMTLDQYGIDMAILSVPFGGGSGEKQKWLEYEFDRISVFDEIFLCLDNDHEGTVATKELIQRLGSHRCRVVKLPYKDANECLKQGVSAEKIKHCFDIACPLDPDELKQAATFVEQVIEEFYPREDQFIGYSLPWEKTKSKILYRNSELSLWTGYSGHGKSQLLGNVLLHFILQGAKVCIASLELKPKLLLKRLTRQAAGLREPTVEYIRAIHEWYQDKLWIFDLVGTTKADRLLEVFKYARQRYGVDVFVIDSLMKCGLSEEDYSGQKLFVEQLCDFKNLYDCHIHLVAHPRKGERGSDESKLPGKLDIRGGVAITDLADNCFCVFRNKLKEAEMSKHTKKDDAPSDVSEKYDALLACSKNRNGEWEGKVTLWFDHNSLQYLEWHGGRPANIVDYSVDKRRN